MGLFSGDTECNANPNCPPLQCPEIKNLPEFVCPNMTCPDMKLPDSLCKNIIDNKMSCGDIHLPEMTCQAPVCPSNINFPPFSCPENRCANVSLVCPECPNTTNILIIMVTAAIVILVALILIYKLIQSRCNANAQTMDRDRHQMTPLMSITANNPQTSQLIDLADYGNKPGTIQDRVHMFVNLDK